MYFAWATKEYILERMTIGQVMMYLKYLYQEKNPESTQSKPNKINTRHRTAKEMNYEELRECRDRLRKIYGSVN